MSGRLRPQPRRRAGQDRNRNKTKRAHRLIDFIRPNMTCPGTPGKWSYFSRIRIAGKISTPFPDGRLGQSRKNSAQGQTGSALCPSKLDIPTDISPDSIRKEL